MQTVVVGDTKLAYEVAGAGVPVLLLHGAGGSRGAWSLQVPALSKRYQVVSVDLRGHGESSVTPAPCSMTALAADLAGLQKALSLGPCHVVGHSLGGMVGLQLALDFPQGVKSLAVVNSTALGQGLWVRSFLVRSFIRLAGMPAFARANAKLHLPEPGQLALRQRFIETMGACPAAGYLAAQSAIDGFDVRARLGEIGCPVLVVHSDQDVIPLEDKSLIAGTVARGQLETIEHSRHIVVWDQPERLNAVLLSFLDGQAAQR